MFKLLPTIGDTVALVGCSNPLNTMYSYQEEHIVRLLSSFGLKVKISPTLYRESSCQERAQALMDMYLDPQVKAIFDISGGDLALGVLEHLDFDVISNNPKPMWGYSDLTCVINGIYHRTGNPQVLYSIRNLFLDDTGYQAKEFEKAMSGGQELFEPTWHMLQGRGVSGTLVGGNIRCFLKLSGTGIMPDLTDKVLFLESRSGDAYRIQSMMEQLRLQGAFDKVKGVLIGTFTELDKKLGRDAALDLIVREIGNKDLLIAYTNDVGHGADSNALVIGQDISI